MIEQQFDIGDEVVYPKGSDRESLSTYVIIDVVYCPSTEYEKKIKKGNDTIKKINDRYKK
jgi:hypothetical protein